MGAKDGLGTSARDFRLRIQARTGVGRPLFERHRRRLAPVGALVIGIGGAAGIGVLLDRLEAEHRAFGAAGLLLLMPVVAASVIGGVLPALVAVAASFGTLYVSRLQAMDGPTAAARGEDLVSLAIYLVVALTLSHALNRERLGRAQLSEAQDRLAFIAGASQLLSGASLDLRKTLSELARLSVPALGDLCVVKIVDDEGMIEPVVVAHDDPVDARRAENLLLQQPPAPHHPYGAPAVIRTGRSEMYSRVDDGVLQRVAWGPSHLNLLRGLQIRSLMIVPLRSPTRVFGSMTLAITGTRGRYTANDLALAEDVAARAATALENVRLYEERSDEALTLQKSLLPAEIPQIPGAEVVVRFRPQGRTYLVGGDFYDVFQIDDQSFGLVVGDVCGKGIEAAALTGLARHTIRIAALREREPRRVLEVLNQALMHQGGDRYCTAIYARLTRAGDSSVVTFAAGGHPLPLLVREGMRPRSVGAPGTLLGIFPDPDIVESSVVLEPGDTLVLYTDGVLDERDPDPERLLGDLVRGAGADPAAIADTIERAVAHREPAVDDDVAMVVLRATPIRTVRLPHRTLTLAETRERPSDIRAQ